MPWHPWRAPHCCLQGTLVLTVAVTASLLVGSGAHEVEEAGVPEVCKQYLPKARARDGEGADHEGHRAEDGHAEEFHEHGAGGLAEAESEGEEDFKEPMEGLEESETDIAISGMLLGGVSFVMALFLLVNMEDQDMQFYAWSVISKTISIFVSVLFFQMVHLMVHDLILHRANWYWHRTGDFFMMMMFYVILQVSVAYLSGAFEDSPYQSDLMTVDGKGAPVRVSIEVQKGWRILHMRCWATLFSHMAGFAAINFGGVMQQGKFFKRHPPLTFIIVPLMYLGQILTSRLVRKLRRKLIDNHHHSSGIAHCDLGMMSQMLTDEAGDRHVGRGYALHKWDEMVYESENDIAGLVVSFLTVQACRFNISGVLPNSMGIEEEYYRHGLDCTIKLVVLTIFFALFTMIAVMIFKEFPKHVQAGTMKSLAKRMVLVMQNAMAMSFAWGLLYASKWEMARTCPFLGNPNTIVSRVVLALAISFLSFIMIRLLDLVADSDKTGDDVDMAIFSIIGALGILVGFSWEQAFEGGVEVIAALTPYPLLFDCGLAVVIALVVITPWRRHILNKVIELENVRTQIYHNAHRRTLADESNEVPPE